jgi:hypothetical protein
VLQIVKSTRETKPELRKREAKGKDPAVIGEQPTVPDARPAPAKRPE